MGSERINAKERDRNARQARRVKKWKEIEKQRVKYATPTRLIDALIGDEELNGKRGSDPQPSYLGPFSRNLLRAGIIR